MGRWVAFQAQRGTSLVCLWPADRQQASRSLPPRSPRKSDPCTMPLSGNNQRSQYTDPGAQMIAAMVSDSTIRQGSRRS